MASLNGNDNLFWLKKLQQCVSLAMGGGGVGESTRAGSDRPFRSGSKWARQIGRQAGGGRGRAGERGKNGAKSAPSLPLPSPRPRSVRLSEGVEVLMRTRNNKTKRPSVTRPDRQHYNNSFNRTPAPLFIVHTLCTHAKSDAEADLSVADRLASLYCNCATACTTTSFPNLHPATKISNRLTQRHVVNVTSLQE